MSKTISPLPINCKLKFWFQHFVKGEGDFEQSLRPLAVISSVEQFWGYYQHFKRPTDLPLGSYLYLFKEQIKPVWEDQNNKNGGAFVLRFEKGKINRLWEDILLEYISAKTNVFAFLNGIRLKVKKDFAEIDFWVRNVDDHEELENTRKWIIKATSLENHTPLQVIQFQTEQ